MTTKTYHDVWVCVDCYFAHHYGRHEHEGQWFAGESDTPSDRKPLGLLDGDELSDNTCSDHDGTPEQACTHCGNADCETGEETFSMSSCRGCGSHLGGARYRLAVTS